MNTNINQDQIDYYQRNGFLLLDTFLDDMELNRLRNSVSMSIEQMGKRKLAGRGKEMWDGDEYRSLIFIDERPTLENPKIL